MNYHARLGVKDKVSVHAVHDPIPLCPKIKPIELPIHPVYATLYK